jgi:hypothetical protein
MQGMPRKFGDPVIFSNKIVRKNNPVKPEDTEKQPSALQNF